MKFLPYPPKLASTVASSATAPVEKHHSALRSARELLLEVGAQTCRLVSSPTFLEDAVPVVGGRYGENAAWRMFGDAQPTPDKKTTDHYAHARKMEVDAMAAEQEAADHTGEKSSTQKMRMAKARSLRVVADLALYRAMMTRSEMMDLVDILAREGLLMQFGEEHLYEGMELRKDDIEALAEYDPFDYRRRRYKLSWPGCPNFNPITGGYRY